MIRHQVGTDRMARRARMAFAGLMVSAGFVVIAPSEAAAPNSWGAVMSGGAAKFVPADSPSQDAPGSGNADNGRKIR